ncbi:cytochrome c oxidase assembly factor CtaG [Peribacillus cavernae]|uniref:Cytochrome c oxidase assembly factor CtaG n=1 Tax=Peribacillus cavernae TaxID=1674310 RepID=A0A3S0TYE4_9BACI|nr:cytochrome c oxidase assembly factor CtaG [Peribacillus cavernae]MDQ0217205.1 putative membrane protein [Peribacillus cavernae]RUQ30324.1 cytochrome c oxidase assembly factor CtaG [Peribacillus cavernae]
MSIDIFGFRALWSPYFFVALVLITFAYFMLVTKYRNKFAGSESISRKQSLLFVTFMILLYVIKGSPIDLLGHIMFSVHMVQMAILYLIMPPLLILSIPNWLWSQLFSVSLIDRVFKAFTKPLIALVVFNLMFSFYHLPLIFDFIKTDMWMHALYTVVLFLTAIFMWFPLVNQLPEKESLSGLQKVGYIFGNGILLTPACALIIFASNPLYDTFTDATAWAQAMELCVPASALSGLEISGPELFNGMPPLEDQRTGGVLMKIIQEIVYGIVLGYVFFAWYRKEGGGPDKIDPLPADIKQ